MRDPYQETAALHALGPALAAAGDQGQARFCLASAYDLADRLGIPEAADIAASLKGLVTARSEDGSDDLEESREAPAVTGAWGHTLIAAPMRSS